MAEFTVVGGGIAGLVVARRLAAAGRSVVLYEASDRLGGTVFGHVVGGLELDAGAESFATRGGAVEALAGELGLGADVVSPAPIGGWLLSPRGRAVPLPATSILGIPARPLARDVITAVGLPAALRAALDRLLPRRLGADATTVGALVRARMGSGLLVSLVAPVAHGIHSRPADQLVLDQVAPGLRAELARGGSLGAAVAALRAAAPPGSAVRGLRGGVHRLVPALAGELDRLGVQVRLGEHVEHLSGLAGTVVVAAPGIAQPAPPGLRIVLATLVVEHPGLDAAPRGSGLLIAPGTHGVRARGLTHATAKWPWLREIAGGRHVLRLSYDDEPADLLEAARRDAEVLLGIDLPASAVLDAARVERIRPGRGIGPASVTVVGESAAGSGLAGIVAHANREADRLLGVSDALST